MYIYIYICEIQLLAGSQWLRRRSRDGGAGLIFNSCHPGTRARSINYNFTPHRELTVIRQTRGRSRIYTISSERNDDAVFPPVPRARGQDRFRRDRDNSFLISARGR